MAGLSEIVCGPGSVAGVTYVVDGSRLQLSCGVDSNGNTLYLQVRTDDRLTQDGTSAGLQVGGAVLFVLATAWGIRAVHRFIQSSGEA